MTFHCSNKLFWWFKIFLQILSLQPQISKGHISLEQFCKQNTIVTIIANCNSCKYFAITYLFQDYLELLVKAKKLQWNITTIGLKKSKKMFLAINYSFLASKKDGSLCANFLIYQFPMDLFPTPMIQKWCNKDWELGKLLLISLFLESQFWLESLCIFSCFKSKVSWWINKNGWNFFNKKLQ